MPMSLPTRWSGRLGLLVALVAVAFLAPVATATAVAGPVWKITSHHAPSVFQAGELAEYRFAVSNVGDAVADPQRSDSGTPDDSSDDVDADPISIEIDLPAGVETAIKPTLLGDVLWDSSPLFGRRFDDCGAAVAGESSITCRPSVAGSPAGEQGRVKAGTRGLGMLTVFVRVAADATGPLTAQATIAGGGAAAVTVSQTAPVGPAPTEFGIAPGTFVADAYDKADQPIRQAGAHPYRVKAVFGFNLERTFRPGPFDPSSPLMPSIEPIDAVRTIEAVLPRGFVGNPLAADSCPAEVILQAGQCPLSSQVGTLGVVHKYLLGAGGPPVFQAVPVYNMPAPRGTLAQFGLQIEARLVAIVVSLDPRDYSVVATVAHINETLPVQFQELTLWGVPGDPGHDSDRSTGGFDAWGASVGGVKRPFLTLPSECGVTDSTDITRLLSWGGVERSGVSSDPIALSGCERQAFAPAMSIQPTSVAADGATGLVVDLGMAQSENPDGLGTPPLKKAVVSLPEGMTINPAAADGLAACSDDELGLGTNHGLKAGEPQCPDASKVGSVTAYSPALEDPVEGDVFVRSQNSSDPASGEMFRLAMVVKDPERGVIVKLPGSVKADPSTGRLTATFDDNPQLPVERIVVRLKGGDRAPLANPDSCGTKTVSSVLSSWGGHTVPITNSFTIPCPAGQRFSPTFSAGSLSPVGGSFSPFVARIERAERDQYLSEVDIDLPKGLIAKLKGVALCPDSVAGDGTPGVCPQSSRVGTATVAAGSGSPFYLQGPVYLTGAYKGAPYGLSVQVPAKAGPFDLGMVKVRNALHVNPVTAQVSVVSDRLPQIVKGVPVRLRSVDVDVDRPGFTINPTSCTEKQIDATFTSAQGATSKARQRFQLAGCRSLGFKPRMAMRLTGRRQMQTGGNPGLTAVVSQKRGQANIEAAKVTLPRSLALDPNNTVDPKLVCDYDRALKADCPASSVIGKANAVTPVLNKPLVGDVHLVQGITFGKKGNRIRTLPTLLVKLRGQVAIDLRARTSTQKKTNRLVTTFPAVPDAPVSKFTMRINGGPKGILAVTRTAKSRLNLCTAKQTASVETDGHNGRRADFATTVKTPCGAGRAKPAKPKRRR